MMHSRDYTGAVIAFGLTMLIFWEVFINIGMTLGLMPVVGIPLPFISYGGTALLSNLIAVGILINIRTHRFELFH